MRRLVNHQIHRRARPSSDRAFLHALTSVAERLLVLHFGKIIGIGDPKTIIASQQVREIYLGIEV